jgi:hypothetical protein
MTKEALDTAKDAHGAVFRDILPAGHRCGPVNCTEEQWDALTKAGEMEKAARAKLMPTERDAITLMFDCYQRLKELGWNDACYCPKDGTPFDAIEAGSSGIHDCHYEGDWPTGRWWISDGDLWPSRPILFRLRSQATTLEGDDRDDK